MTTPDLRRGAMLLLISACGSAILHAAPPPTSNWEVIPELTDEFNGDTLDAKKWHDHNPNWKGRKPGFFSRKNVKVKDGELHLTARAEELKNLPEGFHTFTTAAVKSTNTVLYGYFEIRSKAMDSRCSSAFWFYKHEPEWWTEIDVFEVCSKNPKHDSVYHMNTHVFVTPEDGKKHSRKGGEWKAPFLFSDDYHVYALEWNRDEIKWYVDGEVKRTQKNTHWHQPLHMNFDSETFPNWFGLPDKKNLPSTFSIDYVRSWKMAEGGQAARLDIQNADHFATSR